ncbi:MAG: NAD-dependent succinate-semialdehyde dehydrogenase, partial [Acidobacteriaceae bacterium]|nr:NAD-dependent succinate-semialdehyde dehydrogenase [Acidobacteriaceae bacterium]
MTSSALALTDPTLLRTQAFVNGAWVDSERSYPVVDPADGARVSVVPDMTAADAARAIDAAHAAQPGWSAWPASRRATVLRRWYDLVLNSADDLARLITAEQGKPLTEADAEVRYGAGFIEWFAEEAKRVYGETVPAPSTDRRILVLRQPIGVAAAITPWNFPLAMITRKAAAALAAGCTIVVKPAELTPLTALALAELGTRAGLPPGVLNIVTTNAPAAVGTELCRNPLVRKLSFTGSTEVGRLLLRQAADTVKKCSMELGGNAPVIVFDDADLDVALRGVMNAKFRNAGQACIAANRILVQSGVHDRFAEAFGSAITKLRVGPGREPDSAVGPLIDTSALEKVEAHVQDAIEKGARIAVGGKRHVLGGTFYHPTLLTGVTEEMRIFREETFGPVGAILRFEKEEEAIRLANDSEFGLAAYLYTRDVSRAFRAAEALEAGMIGLNEGMISTEVAPFGGIKQSGLGREGSRHGI